MHEVFSSEIRSADSVKTAGAEQARTQFLSPETAAAPALAQASTQAQTQPVPATVHPTDHVQLQTKAAQKQPVVALIAASLDILGGQGVQARTLVEGLQQEGYAVRFIPINPVFPPRLQWLRRLRYMRTLVNQALY